MRLTGRHRTDCAAVSAAQVKGNDYVFGAYTHCAWPAAKGVVADPTGKSFIFSLVNNTGRAARFSLRDKDRAIRLSDYILFGSQKFENGKVTASANFMLLIQGAADVTSNIAYSKEDNLHAAPYQPDDGAVYNPDLFAGEQYFAAAEMEVYQL